MTKNFPQLNQINDNPIMLETINAPLNENLVVVWHPWTWKTVAGIHRFVKLFNEWKKVLFLCYNRLLREQIKRIIKNNFTIENFSWQIRTLDSFFWLIQNKKYWDNSNIKYVNQMRKNEINELINYYSDIEHYDAIIIDEWQDFSLEILENLEKITNHISIFMDKLQIVNVFDWHNSIDYNFLEQEKNYNLLVLTKNYRTPWNIYEQAINWFVSQNEDLIQTESINEIKWNIKKFTDKTINEIIDEIEKFVNKSDWNIWIFINKIKNAKSFYWKLKDKVWEKIPITIYTSTDKTDVNFSEKVIITTFKSAKWLEFDNVIVLITPEDKEIENINSQLFVLSTRTRNNIRFYFLNNNEI